MFKTPIYCNMLKIVRSERNFAWNIKISPLQRTRKRFVPSVNINAREDSMQYVSRYINHKHGIKTARGICARCASISSNDILGESVEEKSNSDALWKSRDAYFLSVDLTFNADDIDLWYERKAGWLTRVSLKSSIPHFFSIALRKVAPRISISENIRTISSVLRKYILHHSERFKHRSITALIVSFVRQNSRRQVFWHAADSIDVRNEQSLKISRNKKKRTQHIPDEKNTIPYYFFHIERRKGIISFV